MPEVGEQTVEEREWGDGERGDRGGRGGSARDGGGRRGTRETGEVLEETGGHVSMTSEGVSMKRKHAKTTCGRAANEQYRADPWSDGAVDGGEERDFIGVGHVDCDRAIHCAYTMNCACIL